MRGTAQWKRGTRIVALYAGRGKVRARFARRKLRPPSKESTMSLIVRTLLAAMTIAAPLSTPAARPVFNRRRRVNRRRHPAKPFLRQRAEPPVRFLARPVGSHQPGRQAGRTQPDRSDPGRLRAAGKLGQPQWRVRQELQHLQCRHRALGTVLGRQQRLAPAPERRHGRGQAWCCRACRTKPMPRPAWSQRERITWTPNADGSVRQHWETSTDDGKTWKTSFDGLYRHPPGGSAG